MSHNVLRSFMSDLLDADSSVSIMEDNARTCGPIRTRVRRTHSDSSATETSSSSEELVMPSRRRFSDCSGSSSSTSVNNRKRLSRWESIEEKGGLVTPKRCHSPMRLPLRSLAHHMDFGFSEPSKQARSSSSLSSTLNLVDEAINVCAQANSGSSGRW
eukprot:CAMPEP_0117013456 /NCGR_PEP_ID=MMETSP0472-20121206/11099_1 /TAXON_ID=693140 ORGANISM="Tiarina fusus, Strain LIS" /NCGR_SAMPLE_ID=MMETSP0472 /ASSEMBLY_ACC=CAM_ASM_000603 /LENGTH=157 /DNA_ID=CAMNT_0004716769 /DNA_START=77 /DNA_END=550 /DNA_ORIENTATION=+